MGHTAPLDVRFWNKVTRGAPNDCWPWRAAVDKKGYGKLGIGPRGRGWEFAHRVSWTLHHGSVPAGKQVLHDCPMGDNPRCVNPKHLWLGDVSANMQDKIQKDRHQYGARCTYAKLTEAQVLAIRADGRSDTILAPQYNVSRGTIHKIRNRLRWKHLP